MQSLIFRNLITRQKILGGRHCSVVSSAPTILRPWVRIPSTPSMLFSICIEIVMRKNKNKQKEAGIGPFFKKQLYLFIYPKRRSAVQWYFPCKWVLSASLVRSHWRHVVTSLVLAFTFNHHKWQEWTMCHGCTERFSYFKPSILPLPLYLHIMQD